MRISWAALMTLFTAVVSVGAIITGFTSSVGTPTGTARALCGASKNVVDVTSENMSTSERWAVMNFLLMFISLFALEYLL
jgi:hypothetical protein